MQKLNRLNSFEVTLITGRVVSLSRQETTRVFLHPWILMTYSALSLMTVAMNQVPWTQGMPIWLRTAIYFLSSVVGLSMAWATLMALSWAVTWGFMRRVHSIIFDLTGAFMSLFTTYCLVGIYKTRPHLFSISSVFLYAFYIVIIVHVSIFLWSAVIPRILLQVRGRKNAFSQSPIDDGINAEKNSEDNMREEYPDTLQNVGNKNITVVIGGTRIPTESILHIRAEGNYVRIYTAKSTYFEAATMKAALLQIPDRLGLRVHRSHWIAYSAVESVANDGRNLKVLLTSGAQVPVSRSNLDKVKKMASDTKFSKDDLSRQ